MAISEGNVSLYYIDGISRENTPYFPTIVAQNLYFERKANIIDETYYVPHYKDVIKFDTDDVSILSKYNYLSIYFGGKYFYYFIKGVEYISEDVIQVSIEMDTIQTFMFNIIYHDGIIERRHIDRWVFDSTLQDYVINRNYIRENFSNGVWTVPQYNYITLDTVGYAIGITKKIDNDRLKNLNYFYFGEHSYSENLVRDTGIKYYAPFGLNYEVTQIVTNDGQTSHSYNYNAYHAYGAMYADPDIESIVFIPFNPFTGITKTLNTLNVNYSENGGMQVIDIEGTNDARALKINNDAGRSVPSTNVRCTFKTYSEREILPLPNLSADSLWNPGHESSMYDENYMRVNFGERSYTATFPLYYTNKRYLYLKYSADISTGKRLYGITDSSSDVTFSKGGIVMTQQSIYLTKMNDTWRQWEAQNRATIPLAMANYFIQGMAGGLVSSGSMAMLSAKETNYYNFLQSDYAQAKGFKASTYQQRLFAAEKNQIEAGAQARQVSNAHSLVNVAASEYNAWLAPDSIKQSSAITPDTISGAIKNIYYEIKVIDFNQCAYIYHQFGNLVNEPLPTSQFIFDEFLNRTKFDYFKFSFIDLDIDMLCAESMINDLKGRFVTGIRQWYNPDAMCDYTLCNLERSLT